MTSTSIHETQRRLRVLSRHLDRHPHLPAVTSAGTDFVAEVGVTVAGEQGTTGFLAWAESLEHPRVRMSAPAADAAVLLRCSGRLGGDVVWVTAHVDDLPPLSERDEAIPLLGFRHLLAQAGWTRPNETEASR